MLCFGKCALNSSDIKLNVDSVDRIPNFFTKNTEGKIVVAPFQPMMTLTTPKDHNTWVQIELKTINGKSISELSELEKHVSLGIKKHSENNYFCILNANSLSEYVDLFDWDSLELVPLLSNKEGIIAPGKAINPEDFGLTDTDSFDFGSVYRISVKNEGAWLKRETNLRSISTVTWDSLGQLGIGTIMGKDGEMLCDQLLIISDNAQLAYSSDGIHWNKYGLATDGNNVSGDIWPINPVYGNGIWAIISREQSNHNIVRSIDGGKTWLDTGAGIRAHNFAFGDGKFMAVSGGIVYASSNAQNWNAIGQCLEVVTLACLVYGKKWLYIPLSGYIYCSGDGEGQWELISDELANMNLSTNYSFEGGCYGNGYFYTIHSKEGKILRSIDGIKWSNVTQLDDCCRNLTYYKNRLYSLNREGTFCYIGLPNP